MDIYDSTDRRPGSFVLFGMGAASFLLAAAGVIVGSPGMALFFGLVVLGVLGAFGLGALLRE